MNMENKDYFYAAMDMAINFLKEQGMKYRRGDFTITDGWKYFDKPVNRVYLLDKNAVMVIVRYDYGGERGKKLKILKDRFLNYINARVKENEVFFTFSFRELDLDILKTDTTDEKIEAVIQRVSKLLALADTDKNNSEAEAIAASMKAQELLAKYNLDIETVTGKPRKEEIEQCIADVGTGKKWKYNLATVVAKSYCCRTFTVGAEQVVFYGFKSDVVIARRVFCYLFEVGNRLANAYAREHKEIYGTAEGIYNSFCVGFISGIDEQLTKNCTALMLVVPKLVNESYEVFSENFKRVNRNVKAINGEAYEEGKIEGKRALNAQYLERGN